MADLNEAILPSVWTLARRALVQGSAPSLDVLVERLTPTGLLRRTGDGAATSRHVGPSLRALLSLGVITEAGDGAISLADPESEESEFRFRVGQALLRIPDGDDPWLVREGTGSLGVPPRGRRRMDATPRREVSYRRMARRVGRA